MIAAKLVFSVKHTVIHPLGDYPVDFMKRIFEEGKQDLIDELSKEFKGAGRELLDATAEIVEIVET